MSKPMSLLDAKHPRVVPGGIQFAIWLREQMQRHNWEPPEAARRFAVSVEITRGYMRGFTVPTPATLGRIESALGAKYKAPAVHTDKVTHIQAKATVQVSDIDSEEVIVTLRISRAKLRSLLE